MALAITAISKKRNYNKKTVVLTIIGTDFPEVPSNLYLSRQNEGASGTVLFDGYTVVSATKITAELRLYNARKGLYDLNIIDGVTLATLKGAFRVQS
jgi:hypothetical protein